MKPRGPIEEIFSASLAASAAYMRKLHKERRGPWDPFRTHILMLCDIDGYENACAVYGIERVSDVINDAWGDDDLASVAKRMRDAEEYYEMRDEHYDAQWDAEIAQLGTEVRNRKQQIDWNKRSVREWREPSP